jgi:Lrp/AsnC family transcriptional regulator, regulator for asnA, asnC and gidA
LRAFLGERTSQCGGQYDIRRSMANRDEDRSGPLDALDRGIIDALAADGRRPLVRIAADLGVSESSVRNRLARLLADGVMQIVAATNPFKLGYGVMSMVGLRVEPGRLHDVSSALERVEEVTYLVACTGRFDLLAEVVCRDNQHLLELLSGSIAAVPGVRTTETLGVLAVLKESYRTALADQPAPGRSGRHR